jgi:hypothetical protein
MFDVVRRFASRVARKDDDRAGIVQRESLRDEVVLAADPATPPLAVLQTIGNHGTEQVAIIALLMKRALTRVRRLAASSP